MLKHIDKFILLEQSPQQIEEKVRQMAVATYSPWSHLKPSDVRLSTFESGMTNRLYRARASDGEATSSGRLSTTSVLVRIFGNDTQNFIDRLLVLSALSVYLALGLILISRVNRVRYLFCCLDFFLLC